MLTSLTEVLTQAALIKNSGVKRWTSGEFRWMEPRQSPINPEDLWDQAAITNLMFQEMRERWANYPKTKTGRTPTNAETDILALMLDQQASRLTNELIWSTWLEWIKAQP